MLSFPTIQILGKTTIIYHAFTCTLYATIIYTVLVFVNLFLKKFYITRKKYCCTIFTFNRFYATILTLHYNIDK